MRLAGFALGFAVAVLFAGSFSLIFSDRTDAPEIAAGELVSPAVTRAPDTWPARLSAARGEPIFLSCYDANGDGRLNAGDGVPLFAGIDVVLNAEACLDPTTHADWYEGTPD